MNACFFPAIASILMLGTTLSLNAATVAHWRMEDGLDGVYVRPTAGRSTIEAIGFPLSDASGNGNTAYTWDDNSTGHVYTDDAVPSVNPLSVLAIRNAGGYPATFTWSAQTSPAGIDLETIAPSAWTIEASFKASTVDASYRTFVGREGNGVAKGDVNLAPFYFQLTGGDPANVIRILFVDAAGSTHEALSPFEVLVHKWYRVAAVSDGTTLSLYVDQFDHTGYQLVATTDLSGSANSAMVDPGLDANGDTWGWTIGRGRYGTSDNPNENHTDRFFGVIDEVRVSNHAVAPGSFLGADDLLGPGPTLQVSRSTGTLTLLSDLQSIDVVGYSITSSSGSLDPAQWLSVADNYDANNGGSFDYDDNWFEEVATTNELREIELVGDGGQLGQGGSQTQLLLGNSGAWNTNGNEDLAMELEVLNLDFSVGLLPIPVEYVGATPPTLSIDPVDLTPACIEGSDAVSDQFEVLNTGDGTLNYTVTESVDWLSCTPTSGSNTGEVDAVTVNYATAGLSAGTYNGTITLTAAGALDSPQDVSVTLTVGAVPNKPGVLAHRWSFNETSGSTVSDSVGGAHGTVEGTQYLWTGGELSLTNSGSPGQSSGAAETNVALSYVDLPNGTFSALSNAVTFEMWYTFNGGAGAPWQRTLDIGIADTGVENDVETGSTNLFMTCNSLDDTIRWAMATNQPGYQNEFLLGEIGDASSRVGAEQHVVLAYDADDRSAYLYLNAVLMDIQSADWPMASVPDVNNWIGRAQYAGDPLLNGRINELRVYNGLLTPSEIAANLAAGPDAAIAGVSLTIVDNGDGTITLSWPLSASGYTLESSAMVGPLESWTAVSGTPVEDGDFYRLTLQADEIYLYYRLSQ